MSSDAIVLQVDGFALYRDPSDGAFRVRDIDLAERLGYAQPRMIRRLIKTLTETGELAGIHVRSVVERTSMPRGGEPWERFMLLDRAIEEVPPERAAEVLPLVTSTAMTVIRQLMGQKTQLEAFAAIERTRELVEAARKPQPAPLAKGEVTAEEEGPSPC